MWVVVGIEDPLTIFSGEGFGWDSTGCRVFDAERETIGVEEGDRELFR